MYWFTADEHYYHRNVITYCNRPFDTVDEMNSTLINNHNSVVNPNDVVIHAGDFTLLKNRKMIYENIINKLKGTHTFLSGSHDYWIPRNKSIQIWEKNINGYYFVICHYALRIWSRSHYNSINLHGHSHGKLKSIGKQHDIGVDNNNFFPVSFNQIIDIMKNKPDNPNLVRRN